MKTYKLLLTASLLALSLNAQAAPLLQLGIGNGTYDNNVNTVVTTERDFSLFAYGRASGNKVVDTNETHFISVAVTREGGAVNNDFGSFELAGNGFDHNDMFFGVAPFEPLNQAWDAKDLKTRGIVETYFTEVAFLFNPLEITKNFNSKTKPGYIPTDNGSKNFFAGFAINATNLKAGFNLEFDLYTKRNKGNGDIDIKKFAPEKYTATTQYASVAEPSALIIFSLGIFPLLVSSRRRFKKGLEA